jgi:hypothetical protein
MSCHFILRFSCAVGRYDDNPGTIQQFQEWLLHSGVYHDGELKGKGYVAAGMPNGLSLEKINDLAAQHWTEEKQIDPPRELPDMSNGWHMIWTIFKRHLVAQHYEDLAQWATDAGLSPSKIHTSTTVASPNQAVSLYSPFTKNALWADVSGLSLVKPDKGHLGLIMYGYLVSCQCHL